MYSIYSNLEFNTKNFYVLYILRCRKVLPFGGDFFGAIKKTPKSL